MSVKTASKKRKNNIGYSEVFWDDIRSRVLAANPKLASIIDELEPEKEYTFILAKYPYGVKIRDSGTNYFPSDTGKLVTIDDAKSPSKIKSLLSYSSSPLGLVLDKSIEVYAETPSKKRSIPFKVFGKGVTFGVWEIMDIPTVTLRQNWTWNISSGVRSIFMLPSISEIASHAKLQNECGVKSYVPDTIFDHHKIFKEIVDNSENNWCTEVLFFTKKWLEPNNSNIGWVKLQEYWTKEAWWQIQYWANRVILNLNWEQFIAEISRRKIKLDSYLLDTIKQLISIATGTITGFRVCDNSETIAPTKLIEDAYLDIYSLKKYAPLIMQPNMLLPDSPISKAYYSMQYPTLPEKPSQLKSFPSVMKMVKQLKLLMDIFIEIMGKYQPIKEQGLIDFNNNIKFDYFHNDIDRFNIIQPTTTLLKEDPIISQALKRFDDRIAPENSHFFRGCIRISLKDDEG